jgi:hypothetical protein
LSSVSILYRCILNPIWSFRTVFDAIYKLLGEIEAINYDRF